MRRSTSSCRTRGPQSTGGITGAVTRGSAALLPWPLDIFLFLRGALAATMHRCWPKWRGPPRPFRDPPPLVVFSWNLVAWSSAWRPGRAFVSWGIRSSRCSPPIPANRDIFETEQESPPMIMSNNRIEDALPDEPIAPSDIQPPSLSDLPDYAEIAREWVKNHPLPCLAAAFIAGVAIAWIVKRK